MDSRVLCLTGGGLLLFVLLVMTGWAAEDSYISFRVVDNFLAGRGLTWNPGERVQVYTDPLFVVLLIAGTAVLRNVYWASAVISLALTMATYFVLMRRRAAAAVVLGTAMLISSKAFMDFSVSGMENPATNLGIVVFCWAYWKGRGPLVLTLIAAVTAVNRLDSVLLFLPALLLVYWHEGMRAWRSILIGITPLIAWELFSVMYYGFPFPNTAYAKLSAALEVRALMDQGLLYLVNCGRWDVVTAAVISGGILFGIMVGEWPLALGALLSVGYVVRVGGDFMSARFLSGAFVLAAAILIHRIRCRWRWTAVMTAGVLIAGLTNPRPTLSASSHFGVGEPVVLQDGIADERSFFYGATGLLRWRPGIRWPDISFTDVGNNFRNQRAAVYLVKMAGTIPYTAGPGKYALDQGALGDALLARLPPDEAERRPGHYFRTVPPGYFETLATGVDQIQDKNLALYYGHLRLIIRGELWSVARWKAIVAMNRGEYDYLLPH